MVIERENEQRIVSRPVPEGLCGAVAAAEGTHGDRGACRDAGSGAGRLDPAYAGERFGDRAVS